MSVHPFCSSVRPSVGRPVCAVCTTGAAALVAAFLLSSFVASARSYPSASLRNGNAFCFSFTPLPPSLLSLSPSSIEGERARDSFNNPAARSEIYYFRATLLDKSIRLMLILSLSLLLSIRPFVSLQHQPRLSLLFFSFLSLLLFAAPLSFLSSQPRPPSVLSRTSVQGDLIKSVHLNLRAWTVSRAIPPLVEAEDGTIDREGKKK